MKWLPDKWVIIGVVLAVVGIVISVYYGRRALKPSKKVLRWNYESVSLLAGAGTALGDMVEVRVNGEPIRRPHLLTLHLTNSGKRDIDSPSFDSERPIFF